MAKTARLKVYQAPFGFHESVVAAPNQRAALTAWGAHQNLFALGEATEATDAPAIAAALADPGTPLARPLGSSGPFLREPDRPEVPPPAKRKPAGRSAGKTARDAAAPQPTPPSRRMLDRAREALGKIEEQKAQALAEIETRRQALETEAEARSSQFDARIAKAAAELDRAREDFIARGGKP